MVETHDPFDGDSSGEGEAKQRPRGGEGERLGQDLECSPASNSGEGGPGDMPAEVRKAFQRRVGRKPQEDADHQHRTERAHSQSGEIVSTVIFRIQRVVVLACFPHLDELLAELGGRGVLGFKLDRDIFSHPTAVGDPARKSDFKKEEKEGADR